MFIYRTLQLSLFAFCLCLCKTVSAAPSESVRREYALKMHEAFIQQSVGLATQAFFTFKEAYQEALNSGESVQRVQAVERLFYWYRHYGSALGLMPEPSQIRDEYLGKRSCKKQSLKPFQGPTAAQIPDYQSEWGKDPEQARMIRDFIFGVGEVISGVFCLSAGSVPAKGVGIQLLYDGCSRI